MCLLIVVTNPYQATGSPRKHSVALPFVRSWQAVRVNSRIYELCDPLFDVPPMLVESVPATSIFESSDLRTDKEYTRINLYELSKYSFLEPRNTYSSHNLIVFIFFAWAFVLGEYAASQEHGWGIYMANVRKYCSNLNFLMDSESL
jgi:hypothetical protein